VAHQTYTVHCAWEAEAAVWVATSDDVPGLATGADTLDDLVQSSRSSSQSFAIEASPTALSSVGTG
jgi:hypothetical protein